MKERRNSDRALLSNLAVKECNGDYLFQLKASNLSEDGIFLRNKFCTHEHEAHSKLSFALPNGYIVGNIVARIIREHKTGSHLGSAYEFLKVSERDRIELKKFCSQSSPLLKTN